MANDPEPERRIYARPKPDESSKAFTQRFLGLIKEAARDAERDEDRNSN